MEAIYLSRTGRKVLILEKNDQLGGAWGCLKNDQFPYLDIGCHYCDVSKSVYEFLREDVGLDMTPLSPQPQFFFRKFRFPYDYRQLSRVGRELKSAIKRRSLTSFYFNLARDENYQLRFFPFTKAFMFPRGGSREIMNRLLELTGDTDLSIRTNRRVNSIRFDHSQNQVEVTAGGETFNGREVVIGSQAQVADALQIDAKQEVTICQDVVHVNLVIRDRSQPNFSYVRFLQHDAVIRMTDITTNLGYWNAGIDGYRVICIGIRDSFDRSLDDADKLSRLLTVLKEYDLVSPSATCDSSYWSRYPIEFLSDKTRRRLLQDYSPMIRFFPTNNFSVGIASNLDRWKSVFNSQEEAGQNLQSIRQYSKG